VTATRVLLAPGASGGIERLSAHRRGLVQRGFDVELVALPKGAAERALPVYRAATGADAGGFVIGGQSFGGRVASMIAPEVRPAALVLFSYPLHAPGRHEAWVERTAHWPRIECPVLLLSGESDPFARIDLLRSAVALLSHATLVTYPGLGHTLAPVLERALDEVAAFIGSNT
jgi:predicted alpha/beta-hydrolase family hydrolase